MGDFNHGHIQWNSLESTGIEDQQFLFLIQDSFLTQHVLEPTRGENVLDIVLSSQKELVDNVKIFEPLGNSDHNQIHFDINVKSESKNKKTYKRNFHKGNYKDMRKYLAKLDWNNMLMNKTAIECWNILKYEIESIIDKFVPFQKQGKRCRKKHLSKEAIRKIMLKQTMWRVYRRTRKDEDYAKYKEALNAATTEIRQSKRSYKQKLACNIKNDSKSFYAYVRSKQNVQDKVGPLEDSAGNIISQGFLMAEDLNGYFSSVFTKEDISSLPVADAKFQGAKSDYLGPLVVTPELVAKKIKAMKDNKSPGVDGVPPKLLMETVEQISIPLARVFNLPLKEGVVPFEWKEANIIPFFKKGSRNKSENYRPVSLTSVICKLLERLIKDHMVDFLVKHKLLNSSQHGFLKARSCLTNMLCFLEEITKWIDVRSPVDIIYLDFQKAFDKVPRLNAFRRATKIIPELRDLSYVERLKECGLTTLETRRLRGDQIEVFKILNGCENIDRNMFFSLKKDSRTRGHEVKLVKDQCRLDIRKHSFSQRTINEWNKLSTDCVTASNVNMFKNKVDTYLRRAGYK